MAMRCKLMLFGIYGTVFLSVFCGCTDKISSFRPGAVWADTDGVPINAHGGGIYSENGTYYWFGEYKTEGRAGNTAQVGVSVYSSVDLYNWDNRGIALQVNKTDSLSDIIQGCIMERPKVIFNKKTGLYVMYFHLELRGQGYNTARTGIAVSKNVIGPYRYLKSLRPNAGIMPEGSYNDSMDYLLRDLSKGQMARDMTLFVDDDGKAYHIYASEENTTLHIAELTDDYLGYTGRYQRFFIGRYMEAPTLFKRDGCYYFIGSGCTGWAPNAARSARATSIWGPWQELGNPCRGENAELTFGAQSTYVLHVPEKDLYIFMADRWTPANPIDARYVFLPVTFEDGKPVIEWRETWKYQL